MVNRSLIAGEIIISVDELFPYEPSVVKHRLDKLLTVLEKDGDFREPISINKIYGHYIVRHGNHRAYAAKLHGKMTIKAILYRINSKELDKLARDISYRDSQGMQGYASYFIDETDQARDERTLQEIVGIKNHNHTAFIDKYKNQESITFD